MTVVPMLATLSEGLPTGDGWAFEPKYDGIRVLAFATEEGVRLVTRNGKEKATQFPEVAEALRALARRKGRAFVLDGEIVALQDGELARFQALQSRIMEQNRKIIAQHVLESPAVLVAFDVLLDAEDGLTAEPWTVRRQRLERLISSNRHPGLRLGEAQIGHGTALLERARAEGWEGVVAKHTSSRYAPGKRSRDWLKIKVAARQEFVVGGWTEPRLSREHIGALLLGYYDGDRLVYAGHAGGGFTRKGLADMHRRLAPLERVACPFETEPETNEPAHWVAPEVVVEVKFSEWTSDGRLRHPIFLGMRDDRDPATVVRESPSGGSSGPGRRAAAAGQGPNGATTARDPMAPS